MGGKETGCSGARILVGWRFLVGVCERGEVETGLLLTSCSWLGIGWDESVVTGKKGQTGFLDTHAVPVAHQWGLMLRYMILFQS